MKEIKAYIKEFKLHEVTRALHHVAGLTGASVSHVIGFGRGKAESSGFRPGLDPSEFVKHVKVEVVCRDELADAVVDAIRRAAHTGLRGDGKIYVSEVARAVRIETGEEGEP